MAERVNPYREIAERQFSVDGGSGNLVADGHYVVDDVVDPEVNREALDLDPRLYSKYGKKVSKLRWRKVNRNGWISPKRKAQSDKDTVIQIRFARPKRLNYLSFELLRVPQQWVVKYYDHNRKKMVVLTDNRGRKVDGSLSGLKDNVLRPNRQVNGPIKETFKWRHYSYNLPRIRTNLIEIHMNREVDNPPIENLDVFFGLDLDTPYSLGIRNLKIKLKVRNDDDVDDDDDGNPTPIGTSERPVVTRYTSLFAHDGGARSYWECAPQGAANSVVPFYLDMRQSDGTASTFDRIKLKPLWPGPNMSVYWSNDDFTTPWVISPNRKELTRIEDASFTEKQGISVTATNDGWSITNDWMKLDLNQNFMAGFLYTPTDTLTAGDRYLWTAETTGYSLSLRFNPTSLGASAISGTFDVTYTAGVNETVLFTSSVYDFTKDEQYGVVFGYNHTGLESSAAKGWHLVVGAQPATNAVITHEKDDTNLFEAPFYPTGIVLGSDSSTSLGFPMQGSMEKLWIRMDSFSLEAAKNYVKNPDYFINGEGETTQRVNGFYKAVLIAKLRRNLEVRVGPGAGFYTNKEWTPIAIDYGLQASQFQLPLTTAKFLKLEFTKLIPRVYLTQEEVLPVRTFPQWVVDWYRSTYVVGSGSRLRNERQYYESVPALRTPGDPRILPDIRSQIEGSSLSPVAPTLYNEDMSSTDYVINPNKFDGANKYQELEFAAQHMRFFRKGRHQYDTYYVDVQHRAFFVGIKELEVYRSDHTIQFDSREYNETYDDLQNIESASGWINVGGTMSAQSVGARITSKEFLSFSKFETIQMGVLDGGWESGFTDAQIDLGTITHLVDPAENVFDANHDTATTHFDIVTGQYQGARGGNVIEVNRFPGSSAEYGIRTASGQYNGAIIGQTPRTSAVIRMQLSETNRGSYELRIYASGRLVTSRPIVMPIKGWKEIELAYLASALDEDWQVEVVQTNPSVSEPFVVDMLGIWQNPIKWEVSNNLDDPQVILWGGGPDISDLTVDQFEGQDLPLEGDEFNLIPPFAIDEPYAVPQPYSEDNNAIKTVSLSWFGARDPSEFLSLDGGDSLVDDQEFLSWDIDKREAFANGDGGYELQPSPDIAEIGEPEFEAQNLDEDYEPGTYWHETVGFEVTPYEYLLPQSFKFYYNGHESTPVFRGATEQETADNIKAALESLPDFALGGVSVFLGEADSSYTIVFNASSVFPLESIDRVGVDVTIGDVVAGGGWHALLWPLSTATGYFRFPTADYRLRVRATALRANAVVSGWTVVPWYIESPMVMRAPIDYNPPWGVSDQQDLLDTARKPLFRIWNHYFPQRFSVNLYGYN